MLREIGTVIDTDYTDPGHQVKASCTAAAYLNANVRNEKVWPLNT
jgi:hypothetical protein